MSAYWGMEHVARSRGRLQRTRMVEGSQEHADWGLYFPEATGSRQSPIDLVSCDARYEELLANTPLQFSYFTSRETDILNNGYTLVVFPRAKQAMSGGPLPRGMEYELAEMRFHWGRENGRGSEHTVNSKAFPMEVQFVHWNTRLYESFEAAVGRPNGIVIVSLFTQLGREHHGLKLITDNLEDVQYKGRQKTMTAPFNPGSFMPDPMLRDYWTYEGSLTTPPCSENVTWILMRYPLMVSYQQMEEFRRLKTHNRGEQPRPGDDGTMADNFRPTQPLNGRVVRASFQY
ncbi:LOW QUALITY PROTEIN: carbonic anhydrase-related protein-like [Pomacea canaliculata]|uniref:LOW QUALITY PROTEIN: carbonic anhydrase-related protein-like n=1 Tax=Pomacea canaliculata TaxID=400727 RepID=UPI000D730296|nr:LOW QUALITY PROTEIN: carbonic anhydrase-related protein-like [Pomacea canaliculata]